MRLLPCSTRTASAFWLFSSWLVVPNVYAYFMLNTPTSSSKWKLGEVNPIRWTKGPHDGIGATDVELARLSEDGLTFVAKDVPTSFNALNILLQDIPAGDDYFVVLLNSTHGVTYATSQRFSIVASDGTSESPDASVPTVTVSGAPNPTKQWATTLAGSTDAAAPLLASRGWVIASLTAAVGTVLGGYTVLGL
ncbi:hypothetical protein DL96DRAFT_416452 [Flagelloscypha sp. PMI_526]|nr:hypothetical protein DL96DRAFT_416452 [Flagelloscypha sp. PMI_526]